MLLGSASARPQLQAIQEEITAPASASADVNSAPMGPMSYVFRCPHCSTAPHEVDHAELHQVAIGVLGMDWQCPDCRDWSQVRVQERNRGLTVEKGSAPAVLA